MREELQGHIGIYGNGRITPAHAGRMPTAVLSVTAVQDHPRACGKNLRRTEKGLYMPGSPPRMREEFSRASCAMLVKRITPAHAGRIKRRPYSCRTVRDHPRACGKNRKGPRQTYRIIGSPPRMREECKYSADTIQTIGITPAHAGRMKRLHVTPEGRWDHPRACGKNREQQVYFALQIGSPPRMREEFNHDKEKFIEFGITPAHAGRICSVCPLRGFRQDHPRACGKNIIDKSPRMGILGSPPRMREEFPCI